MIHAFGENGILLCRGPLDWYPPLLTVALELRALLSKVTVVTSSCSERLRQYLLDHNISVLPCAPEYGPRNIADKLLMDHTFRRRAWGFIKSSGDRKLLWVGNEHTALVLGGDLWRYRSAFHVLELNDSRWLLRGLVKYHCRRASCHVVPSPHRAWLLRSWYKLRSTPFVLPNVPTVPNRARTQFITDPQARRVLAGLPANTRLLLYQGLIQADRNIEPIAHAVRLLPNWRLVVMGRETPYLAVLKRACPSLLYVPYVSPPNHLEITSHAHVGVVVYDDSTLNNVFCAPNKIFEYAAYGIPMLTNDVPGLVDTVGRFGAGICLSDLSSERVTDALRSLDNSYDTFAVCAARLYDAQQCRATMEQVCSHLLSQRLSR